MEEDLKNLYNEVGKFSKKYLDTILMYARQINGNKKMMISMPMKNKSNEEVKKEFNELKSKYENIGYEVLNTLFDEFDTDTEKTGNSKGIYYLSKSIEVMSNADIVVFAKGWEQARGCKIEHQVAVEYGLEIIYE